MDIIMAFLAIFLVFYLYNLMYTKYWWKNLSIDLSFNRSRVTEGEDNILQEVVINQKALPVTVLHIKFLTSRFLSFYDMDNSSITDNYYRSDVFSLMNYQKITRNLQIKCSKRGFYNISRVDAVCNNLFTSDSLTKIYKPTSSFYVYPKQISTQECYPPFSRILGEILSKHRLYEDPFEFAGIREYQSYDSMKRINYKASAKMGQWMVNVPNYTSSRQVRILLNLESPLNRAFEDLMEHSIRIASSIASELLQKGISVSLCSNGIDVLQHNKVEVGVGSSYSHLRQINDALSRIDLTIPPMQTMEIIAPFFEMTRDKDCFTILISAYQREDLQMQLANANLSKTEFSWILPTHEEIRFPSNVSLHKFIYTWGQLE